jgi:hypothetical protein
VDDELDSVTATDPDLQKPCGPVGADQHREVIEPKYTDRVLEGVEHVVVRNAVLSGTHKDDRVPDIKLS